MGVIIANRHLSSFSIVVSKRDWAKVKKNVKFSKNATKEMMTVSKAELVHIRRKLNSEEKRSVPFKDTIRRCPTLKELQEKKYPFLDLDFPGMPDDLLRKAGPSTSRAKEA